MHEMAIVQSVLDVAFEAADKHSSSAVKKIKLRIGEMSGVVRESIEFAFSVLKDGTPAAGAELEIEMVRLEALCGSCGPASCAIANLNLICDSCGGAMEIVSGREMKVEYVDLE